MHSQPCRRPVVHPGTACKWWTAWSALASYAILLRVELNRLPSSLPFSRGGGVSAQADAVKMGISRALLEFNPELRKTLKTEGLLSRDARIKERKKYGQKGARKRFQFSKR